MEQPNIFMSYLRVTQHMSQQFRSHFGRLDLTFPRPWCSRCWGGWAGTHQRPGRAHRKRQQHGVGHCGPAGKAGAGQTAAQRDGPAGDLCLRHGEVQRPAGKAATDVSGYFSSLLSGMSQEDRAMIAAAFQKLDDALLQAGTEQSGP